MERHSLRVRDLILAQPPIQLLAYLRAQFQRNVFEDAKKTGGNRRPDKTLVATYQFALEYVHAVWSCHSPLSAEDAHLDEGKVASLFEALKNLKDATVVYCMASATHSLEFHAKSTWALLRGNRYQVLEEEFFTFVLRPHATALQSAYGMAFEDIAAGIQSIANTMRAGIVTALAKIQKWQDNTAALMKTSNVDFATAIQRLKATDSTLNRDISTAMRDIFLGGTCNLSLHTEFTTPLLEDLSYSPGENVEFFAEGKFRGTPMRTLPRPNQTRHSTWKRLLCYRWPVYS